MKLHQLRILVAVQECGSIQLASKRLHMTQPAMSRALHELEDELGVPLLVRSSRGVTPTAYGEALLKHARGALESLRRGRQDIDDMKDAGPPQVRIGLTLAATAMAPVRQAIATFRRHHPQVRLTLLELRPAQLLELQSRGALDFAVSSQIPTQSAALEWLPMCSREMMIVARQGHALSGARQLRQLLGATWVSSDPPDDPNSSISRLFERNRMPMPQQVIECSAPLMARELALEADALLFIIRIAEPLERARHLEGLVPLQIEEKVPDSIIGLLCPDPRLLARTPRLLYDQIRQTLQASYPDFH